MRTLTPQKKQPVVVFYQRYNNKDFWSIAYPPHGLETANKLAALGHITAVCMGTDRSTPPAGKDLHWIKRP